VVNSRGGARRGAVRRRTIGDDTAGVGRIRIGGGVAGVGKSHVGCGAGRSAVQRCVVGAAWPA
jgi:hypothetical protein